MSADAKEAAFQQDIINQMLAGGWKLGDPALYNRELALYPSDCLNYVKTTQPKTCKLTLTGLQTLSEFSAGCKIKSNILSTVFTLSFNTTSTPNRIAELLQERRTALISAAVTGKIDMRGWKHPESKTETEVA